jgi:hypothetical protein
MLTINRVGGYGGGGEGVWFMDMYRLIKTIIVVLWVITPLVDGNKIV